MKEIEINCDRCGKSIKRHANAKYCKPCALKLRQKPAHNLNPEQIKIVKRYVGKKPRHEVAQLAGCSLAALRRWARDNDMSLAWIGGTKKYLIRPELIKEVCEYYAKHGKLATKKKYPKVRLRSIIERYYKDLGMPPRQKRWTDKQVIELAKLQGMYSQPYQAIYFNRPNAARSSIPHKLSRFYGRNLKHVNGLPKWLIVRFLDTDKPESLKEMVNYNIVPWYFIQQHIKPGLNPEIYHCIDLMVKFQKILWGRNVKANIKNFKRRVSAEIRSNIQHKNRSK